MPKLRKNRRIETRWGVKYHTALKNAVFITQAPYVPTKPPLQVKEYFPECEDQYTCTQCKDCFHFRSSFEDHIARKSWILGYWCQQCFVTICRHTPTEGSLCSTCVQSDREKRLYLRSRGLRKGQKYGVVRVFYNQCQFFAHLKAHNVNSIYMGDLMLMPLPMSLNDNWTSDIDLTCEALMEHSFIIKIHIMDWLKDKNVENTWWQLASSELEDSRNPVALIRNGYEARLYFKELEISIDEQLTSSKCTSSTPGCSGIYSDIEILDTVGNIDKTISLSSIDTVTSISDESVTENEDSRCAVNDIAFVDCGPTSKHFEPEMPFGSRKSQTMISEKSIHDLSARLQSANIMVNKCNKSESTHSSCTSSDTAVSYGNSMMTPKRNVRDSARYLANTRSRSNTAYGSDKSTSPVKAVTESNIVNVDEEKRINKTFLNNLLIIEPLPKIQSDTPCATEMVPRKNMLDKLKQGVHTLTVNSRQKVVTFQSTKHVNINTIINQLPSHIIGKKKIVFVGQTADAAGVHGKPASPSKAIVRLVPDENEKLVESKKNAGNEKFSQVHKDSGKNALTNQIRSVKDKTVTNKVIYQNGRKYIIKKSPGSVKDAGNQPSVVIAEKDKQGSVSSKSSNGIPALIPLNSPEIENISNTERTKSFHGDVAPLTPSPSPSELSSSSSCDVQSKQCFSSLKGSEKSDVPDAIATKGKSAGTSVTNTNNLRESLTFHKGEDQNLYLDVKFLNQKTIYTIVDTSAMITKCREEMLNEFFHLSYAELKKRYDHLQQTGGEILRVMNFVTDNVINENLKAVNILQTVLKHCIDKCGEKSEEPDEGETEEQDPPLNDWESEFMRADEKSVCKGCNKIMKPKYYIPGFSKSAQNDIYCFCYRHVCHKCYTYQGNSTRFVAHQTFHDKEKPYLCPECYRKFSAFKSLEVHTWSTCFHTLKKHVLGCKICEIDGFQDMESVAKHFAIMHSQKKMACDKCYIVLPSYSDYKKHHDERHPNMEGHHPVRLVLCKLGRCIVRCEDYMSHMEKHLVVQRLIWFKCPFCSFIHVEAERIIAHLHSAHGSRLQELISSEVQWNVLQVENAAKMLKSGSQQNKFMNAQVVSCEDGSVMPKIINARTITSEVFEHGEQEVMDDYLRIADTSQCSEPSLESTKPTPKILDVRSMASLSANSSKCVKSEETGQSVKKRRKGEMKKNITTAKRAKPSRRIALDVKSNINSIDSNDVVWSKRPIDVESSTEFDRPDSFPKIENEIEFGRIRTVKTEKETDGWDSVEDGRHVENARHGSISSPPPLARIPRHVQESKRCKKIGQASKSGNPRTAASSRDQRSSHDLALRIALNSPCNANKVFNFSCHLCGETINTSASVISDHFERNHSRHCKLSLVTTNLLRISPEFINGGYKDVLGNRKRKSDNTVFNSKRRRRWTPKKYSDGKNVGFAGIGLCVRQETAEDSEGNFRCKKCDQRCTDMANLREHIASNHRIKGRYLVCLECGDNFVVAPSLQMHLKAFHGIEDPITYMAQNTSYAPDNVDDLESGGKSIEANQCHVCMAVFEDKAAVDKHLRVHGMAFLNRKRIEAQNAMKSPEKKIDEEEDKRMPSKASFVQPVRRDKPAEAILEKINATI